MAGSQGSLGQSQHEAGAHAPAASYRARAGWAIAPHTRETGDDDITKDIPETRLTVSLTAPLTKEASFEDNLTV